jgi:glycosyltransferase involved in cell wall biosynthesis
MENDQIIFSVILPCYNRGSFLKYAIQSVLDQSFTFWELIIVDDGSTDDTELIISKYNDPRIHYIKQTNQERGAARNNGIKNAKGSWICFLDSDDYLLPNHLQLAFYYKQSKLNLKVFHLNYETRNIENKLILPSLNKPKILNKLLKRINPISCNGMFVQKELFKQFQFSEIRDLSGTEDYYLWLNIAAFHPIYNFNDVTSVLVIHPERSMLATDYAKIENRINTFLELCNSNQQVTKFIGAAMNKFIAWRYSYLSLTAVELSLQNKCWFYFTKSISKNISILFTKRSASIIFKLIRNMI